MKGSRLKRIGENASNKVGKALNMLTQIKFKTESTIEMLPTKDILSLIEEEAMLIAYIQIVHGDKKGVMLLIINKENAIQLSDLLNKKKIGTTIVLGDLERSVLKELCNILTNTYINELSKYLNFHFSLDTPALITRDQLHILFTALGLPEKEKTLLCGVELESENPDIFVTILAIFHKKAYEILNKEVKEKW